MRYAVIMAGGAGKRLWPSSRMQRPKQLLPLLGGKSLLSLAVERLTGMFDDDQIFVITNADYADQIAENPMLADTLTPIGEVYRALELAMYSGLIAGALIFQGLNARYYFSRAAHLAAYLNETPDWIIDLQRRSPGA